MQLLLRAVFLLSCGVLTNGARYHKELDEEALARSHEIFCSTQKDKKRRIVAFLGTFDPPTKAHVDVSQSYLSVEGVDCVWYIPCSHKDYKPLKTPVWVRIDMLRKLRHEGAFSDADKIEISSAYADSEAQVKNVSEMETEVVKHLQARYPLTNFDLAFGSDAITDTKYPMWSWASELLTLAGQKDGHAIVQKRGGVDTVLLEKNMRDIQQKLQEKGVTGFEFKLVPALRSGSDFSSTKLRKHICGKDWSDELASELVEKGMPPMVANYLRAHPEVFALYRNRSDCPGVQQNPQKNDARRIIWKDGLNKAAMLLSVILSIRIL